ncbi:pyruvate, water dikinase regulatory protein [Paenibacillus sp.]|uniref:pyruvate, water dikinase regulatory protein n=1 Tax=Paenibacillus sp. TaxID=58172 RepID=UPI002811267F|nr:pyruvate, water dikinase regulatory protein [Paenibacillus sp.]
MKEEKWVLVCSDSIGETAESVVRATLRQFEMEQVRIKRISHIATEEQIKEAVQEALYKQAFIAYTLVQPELREAMKAEAIALSVRAVDVMGPMMQAFVDTFNNRPLSVPGLLHRLDEDYFRRVEAVEFAVNYDDGKDTRGILEADIVLIGVSRTSKTPLSIFLAHKGCKVANLPLVPEVKAPSELYEISKHRIVGLTMAAESMMKVRSERLKSIGLSQSAPYASMARIVEEIHYANRLMSALGCSVIDVTNKAIEETAGMILNRME